MHYLSVRWFSPGVEYMIAFGNAVLCARIFLFLALYQTLFMHVCKLRCY